MGRPARTLWQVRVEGGRERWTAEGVRDAVALHLHRGGCLILSLRGTWTFRFGVREVRLGPGDLLGIPPGRPHRCDPGEGELSGLRLPASVWRRWALAMGLPPSGVWTLRAWGASLPARPEDLSPRSPVLLPEEGGGLSPSRRGRMRRLWEAAEGLRRGIPGAEVAAACGYADQSHLIREFRRLWGLTPEQYRGKPVPPPGAGA